MISKIDVCGLIFIYHIYVQGHIYGAVGQCDIATGDPDPVCDGPDPDPNPKTVRGKVGPICSVIILLRGFR